MGHHATGTEIAAMIGCSQAAISKMKSSGNIPAQFLKKVKSGGKLRDYIHTDFVDWYRENKINRKSGPTPGMHISNISAEKQKADLAKTLLQTQLLKKRNDEIDGILIRRDDHEKILAGRATTFKTDLYAVADGKADLIVDVCGGDQKKIPDVTQFLRKLFDEIMGRYVNG